MYGWHKMFFFVAIIYQTCIIGSCIRPISMKVSHDNCNCDVLQINDQDGVIGNQIFTKQNETYNGKPYYFSSRDNMISWNNHFWSYDTYDSKLMIFESQETFANKLFSFENMCNNVDNVWNERRIKSRCSRDDSNCSATNDFTRKFKEKQVKLHSKDSCKFPFIYNNTAYKTCIKRNDNFLCAATVDEANNPTSWGFCSNSCPLEEDNGGYHLQDKS